MLTDESIDVAENLLKNSFLNVQHSMIPFWQTPYIHNIYKFFIYILAIQFV